MPEIDAFSRTLPGVAASVAQARHMAATFAGELARLDDVLTIVSELATNAVRHSRSREDGGRFELELTRSAKSILVRVVDQGAAVVVPYAAEADEAFDPGEQPEFEMGESGRGLLIVDVLADNWGHEQYQDRATWWAELWIQQR